MKGYIATFCLLIVAFCRFRKGATGRGSSSKRSMSLFTGISPSSTALGDTLGPSCGAGSGARDKKETDRDIPGQRSRSSRRRCREPRALRDVQRDSRGLEPADRRDVGRVADEDRVPAEASGVSCRAGGLQRSAVTPRDRARPERTQASRAGRRRSATMTGRRARDPHPLGSPGWGGLP